VSDSCAGRGELNVTSLEDLGVAHGVFAEKRGYIRLKFRSIEGG
jgi:hypothetical protein